jgi:ABC-type dipeptide/oligopeptide/nickel transport system permease component
MIWFKILWAVDAVAALAVLYFFLEGIGDGTVSSYNIFLWIGILALLFAVMYGSFQLKKKKQRVLSILLLLVLAIPAFLYVLFILYALSSGMRWN